MASLAKMTLQINSGLISLYSPMIAFYILDFNFFSFFVVYSSFSFFIL